MIFFKYSFKNDTAFSKSVLTALKVIDGQFKLELKLRNAPVKITNVEIFGQFILCRVQKLKLSISQRVGQLLIDCICLSSNVAARYVHSSNFSQQTFNSFNLRC